MSRTTSPHSTMARSAVLPKALREPPPPYSTIIPTDDPQLTEHTPLLAPTTGATQRPRRGTTTSLRIQHQLAFPTVPSEDANLPLTPTSTRSAATSRRSSESYFAALFQKANYRAALHLGIINFPFALLAWIYLFVGTLVGTTLLLTLPFGVLIWWITLLGARTFTRWELAMQSRFHYGRPVLPLRTTLESQTRSTDRASHLESGETLVGEIPPAYELTFLQRTYTMFLDPASYQPLFYFIVIKATTTLLITPLVIAIVPTSLVLVLPAPWVLRKVRRVGMWQADLAFEGLVPFPTL